MCGIAGLIERIGFDAEQQAAGMAAAMMHRGPDGVGRQALNGRPDGCTRLAHRRLAIIDLSDAGRQPMANPQTGDWLIFNGEIYNYRELRRELAERGHRFSIGALWRFFARHNITWKKRPPMRASRIARTS